MASNSLKQWIDRDYPDFWLARAILTSNWLRLCRLLLGWDYPDLWLAESILTSNWLRLSGLLIGWDYPDFWLDETILTYDWLRSWHYPCCSWTCWRRPRTPGRGPSGGRVRPEPAPSVPPRADATHSPRPAVNNTTFTSNNNKSTTYICNFQSFP